MPTRNDVFYMCDGCVGWWRGKGVPLPQGVVRKDGACVMCNGTENVGAIPVKMADPYIPCEWITAQEPAGEPWYLTGYLREAKRG